jgi:hypothetical protein
MPGGAPFRPRKRAGPQRRVRVKNIKRKQRVGIEVDFDYK